MIRAYTGLTHFVANVSHAYDEPGMGNPDSQCCTASQITTKEFENWCDEIRHPVRFHRKLWEWVYILEALKCGGVIESGRKGLGFGVGKERLVSYFAGSGCEVTATDLDYSVAKEAGWVDTNQFAMDLSDLNQFGLCDPEKFEQLVTLMKVDMNNIDSGLRNFDFVWSSCAFEHLGNLENGAQFVVNSMECLKPGGIGVHTTELNVSSTTDTIETGATVLYRRSDIENLVENLHNLGHSVRPVNLNIGKDLLDFQVYHPAINENLQANHLKLAVGGFVTSSFGLIVKKAE